MKQLLIGFFGQGNAGDDAMLQGFLSSTAHWERTISVVCDRLPSLEFRGVAQLTHVPRKPFSLIKAVIENDQVVVVGGTHFHDLNGNKRYLRVLLIYCMIVAFARLVRTETVFLGIGVGPVTTRWGHYLINFLLRSGSQVIVRDKDSLDCSVDMGIDATRCFDLASLMIGNSLSDEMKSKKEQDSFVIGLSVMPAFLSFYGIEGKDDVLVRRIAFALEELFCNTKGFLRVRVFAFRNGPSKDSDEAISLKLIDLLNRPDWIEYIPYENDPCLLIERMRECDAWLGMRYHSCLFSYLLGLPMICVAYHPKNLALANEIGLQAEAIVSMDEAVTDSILLCKLSALYEHPKDFEASLPIYAAVDKAKHGINLIVSHSKNAN